MEDFIQDYQAMNRLFYIENYQLKTHEQLVFLELPPVQKHYPNPERIAFCQDTLEKKKKNKEQRRFSFELEKPTEESPEFSIFGENETIFGKYGTNSQSLGSGSREVEWVDYEIQVGGENEEKGKGDSSEKAGGKNRAAALEEIEMKYESPEEIEKAACLVQKCIRIWKSRKVLEKLRKKRKNRMHGVKEIWKTEVDYVNDLEVLKEVYIEPFQKMSLAKSKNIFTAKDHKQIFFGLETITLFNKDMATSFKKSIFGEDGEYNHFNLLSREIQAITPFLKMYNAYCARYDKTMLYLKELKKNNKRFAQQLEKMDKDPRTSRLGVTNYLIKPIQRIPRYTILLKAVIKNTEPEHPDYDGLKKAMKEIEETASVLNNRMHEITNSEKVLSIQQEFNNTKKFVIHQTFRRFVKEGEMICGKSTFYVHLFNDVMVFSKKQRNKFDLDNHISMLDLVLALPKGRNILFRKHIRINDTIYQLESKELKDEWVEAIVKTKKEWLKNNPQGISNDPVRRESFYPRKEEFSLSDDECIMEAKNWEKPTVMLKYTSRPKFLGGGSHYRKFLLSPKEDAVMWGSPKKSIGELRMEDIKEISNGQNTLTFQKNPKPSAIGLSFSLCYGKGVFEENGIWTGKSLDLICMNKRDYEVWVRALKFVIQDRGSTVNRRTISNPVDEDGQPLDYGTILKLEKEEMIALDQRNNMGDLYTFGGGRSGGLGHWTLKDVDEPKIVRGSLLVDIEKVDCGKDAVLAVLGNGHVLSWGQNEGGRLGQGTKKNYTTPSTIESLQEYCIVEACIGDDFSLFLDLNGTILGCGSNKSGCLTSAIAEKALIPEVIETSGKNEKFLHVSCSPNTAAAVTHTGKVYVWGNGSFGQTGHNSKENVNQMKQVELLKDEKVVQVAFGNWHTLFLTEKGEVWCSGDGSFGQMGMIPRKKDEKIESTIPVKIKKLKDIVSIASGQFHCGAIDKDGRCFMWGAGAYGQIGNNKMDKINYVPVEVKQICISGEGDLVSANDYRFMEISCGDNHNIGIVMPKNETSDLYRQVVVWGLGIHGRLGLKGFEKKDVSIPTCLTFFNKKNQIRSVCAGGQMSSVTIAHQTIPDEEIQECMNCGESFKFTRRRRRCRWCGGVFCAKCTKKKTAIMAMGFDQRQRVCDSCFNLLQKITE